MPKSAHGEDEPSFKADNGSKWVKTDSECEFLYINYKHIDAYSLLIQKKFKFNFILNYKS